MTDTRDFGLTSDEIKFIEQLNTEGMSFSKKPEELLPGETTFDGEWYVRCLPNGRLIRYTTELESGTNEDGSIWSRTNFCYKDNDHLIYREWLMEEAERQHREEHPTVGDLAHQAVSILKKIFD